MSRVYHSTESRRMYNGKMRTEAQIANRRATKREYKRRHPGKPQVNSMKKLRLAFIREYGGRCQCECGCQESTPECLTCDHIFNDGAQEFREWFGEGRRSTNRQMRRLKILGWPKGRHRVLCYNCNCGRQRTADKRCPKIKA